MIYTFRLCTTDFSVGCVLGLPAALIAVVLHLCSVVTVALKPVCPTGDLQIARAKGRLAVYTCLSHVYTASLLDPLNQANFRMVASMPFQSGCS